MQVSSQINSNRQNLKKSIFRLKGDVINYDVNNSGKICKPLSNLKLEKRSKFNSLSPTENASSLIHTKNNNQIGIFERSNMKKDFGLNITNKVFGDKNQKKFQLSNLKKLSQTTQEMITPVKDSKQKINKFHKFDSFDQNDSEKAELMKKAEIMTVKTGVTFSEDNSKSRKKNQSSYEKKLIHLAGI